MAAPGPLLQGPPVHAAPPETGRGSVPPPLLPGGGSRYSVSHIRAPPAGTASPARAGRARSAAALGPTRGPGSPWRERPQARFGAGEPNSPPRTSRIQDKDPAASRFLPRFSSRL
ncbi:hypothetical protein NDU88_012680 [Pleurodeles waltl]|uniref:Uncharacterized protein n=1 Tax=Pleurodeles waltl TaxID=8319 RepID=A0AAV7R6M3_PLEWA|nr:hypothetical protein NDU88_012680 [Pleurodeles waltl]